MSLGHNHACAGKTNSSKTAHLLRKASTPRTLDAVLHEGFPSPWKALPDSDPVLWKQVFPRFPCSLEHAWTFQRWRPCGLDISSGEDVSGLIAHETRDPDRAASVSHLKTQIKSPYRSYLWGWCALPFLLRSGREDCLPSWPACVTGHEHGGLVCLS